jgi:hypothetical protein
MKEQIVNQVRKYVMEGLEDCKGKFMSWGEIVHWIKAQKDFTDGAGFMTFMQRPKGVPDPYTLTGYLLEEAWNCSRFNKFEITDEDIDKMIEHLNDNP